ncbi:MAG: hypothetical protein LUC88_02465 [Prevotella sp.]|nr:hypothetical protein [Prevotella sp.]
MSFFGQQKPRRFHHDYMFVDERKDRLKEIERRAKGELGESEETHAHYDGARLRGRFLNATKYAKRHNARRLGSGVVLSFGVLVVLILLLVAVWRILLCI